MPVSNSKCLHLKLTLDQGRVPTFYEILSLNFDNYHIFPLHQFEENESIHFEKNKANLGLSSAPLLMVDSDSQNTPSNNGSGWRQCWLSREGRVSRGKSGNAATYHTVYMTAHPTTKN
jgi:hypothetical protein